MGEGSALIPLDTGTFLRACSLHSTTRCAHHGPVPFFAANSANATYSTAACDAGTRAFGVAVQTNNLAIGASVPFAKAGIGAGAWQFKTHPHYGPRALELLAQGNSPEQVMNILLQEHGNFEGQGPEARQVGIVSLDGRAFVSQR